MDGFYSFLHGKILIFLLKKLDPLKLGVEIFNEFSLRGDKTIFY